MTTTNGSNGDRLVTATEIAEIAGVQPSAVSNWRKRFPDFPRPAGTAPSGGDLFRLDDVERWLRSSGRSQPRKRGAAQQLWAVADTLRGKALAGDLMNLVAIAAAFLKLARERPEFSDLSLRESPCDVAASVEIIVRRLEAGRPELGDVFRPLFEIDARLLQVLLDTLAEFETSEELVAAVEEVLARGTRYGEFRTSPAVADLILELAQPHRHVFDPACGSGEFLLRAAAANPDNLLCGQELNLDTWRLAMARFVLHDVDATLALGDSFAEDFFLDFSAEVVLCEPPAGGRAQKPQDLAGDRRWQLLGMLDSPPPRAADFAWLAHVIHHLADDGRGYVLLPAGSLFRAGVEARMRSELLRQGTVEAIITLPAGALQGTTIPSALWVLRPPTLSPDRVLLIAGDDETSTMNREFSLRVVETVRTWRTRRNEFQPTAGFATDVEVLELLAGDASLVPSRWLYEPELVDMDAILNDVREAKRDLQTARDQTPLELPEFEVRPAAEPAQRLRIKDLVEHGLARLVRPSRLKTDDYLDEGIPVWLPGDVREPWRREAPPRFADPAQVDSRSITEPGDIVFTTIGGLRTRVDTEGGHLLGTSLQALRVKADTFDPQTVGALMTSEPNRRLLTGSAIPRVNVLELEIPHLVLDEARRVANVLEALERQEEAGHQLSQRAGAVREAIVAALATGAATIGTSTGTDDD